MERIGIEALIRAIEVLGGQGPTSEVVGVKQPSVSHIVQRGLRVPAEWCLPLERATTEAGQPVSRHDLRPDIYPPHESPRARAKRRVA